MEERVSESYFSDLQIRAAAEYFLADIPREILSPEQRECFSVALINALREQEAFEQKVNDSPDSYMRDPASHIRRPVGRPDVKYAFLETGNDGPHRLLGEVFKIAALPAEAGSFFPRNKAVYLHGEGRIFVPKSEGLTNEQGHVPFQIPYHYPGEPEHEYPFRDITVMDFPQTHQFSYLDHARVLPLDEGELYSHLNN